MSNSDEMNLFRAPEGSIGGVREGEVDTNAELIRRTYLKHESSVISLGILSLLLAIFLASISLLLMLVAIGMVPMRGRFGDPNATPTSLAWTVSGVLLGLAGLYATASYGLRHLQGWGRWLVVVLCGLSIAGNAYRAISAAVMAPTLVLAALLGFLLSIVIPSAVLWLLLSSQGAMVFSAPYREVVRLTPEIVYQPGCLMKGMIAFFVFVMALGAIGIVILLLSGP